MAWLLPLLAGVGLGAAELQTLRGHLPAGLAGLTPVGELPGSNRLRLAIGLPLRNREALTNLLQQIYDPASPNYRRYLTADQFAERFGPAERDYQAVIEFAHANGLSVSGTHPNRLLLDVSGTAADIEKALHVRLRVYQHPTEARTFYAPETEPALTLAVPIVHIGGLDNFSRPRPRLHATVLEGRGSLVKRRAPTGQQRNDGSGPSGTYMGSDFRAAYLPGSPLTGSGQTLGLLEFDGYYTRDIAYYETQAGLPSVTLTPVLLGGFTGVPTGNGGEIEVSLDIEVAISMAPGLNAVIVYEENPSTSNWHDVLNRMATDNLAKQLSCSWYLPGGGPDPVADQIFQQMAAQGQSFFNASGDSGAYTGLIDFPGDNPYITQVGGTTLTTSGPGGSWVSETVWNAGDGTASGGGISTSYPIPSWQAGVNMAACGGSATMRNTPDVALTADNVYVRVDDEDDQVMGTSCAAPLWAAFTALINQHATANSQPPVGFINPALYALGLEASYTLGFHDITTGNNTWSGSPNQFYAVPGYDLCTGWGTPNGTNLIAALVPPPDPLRINPQLGFAAAGSSGGPFTPSTQPYSLKNTGATPLNWVVANNAAWLTVSPAGGQVKSGGPVTVVTASIASGAASLSTGAYTATIWFTNLSDGVGQARQFSLQISNSPVVITQQPASQVVLAGGAASFQVGATGTRPSYGWLKNGTRLMDGGHISGSATSTLTVTGASAADAGVYSVIVSNLLGPVSSAYAGLSVYSPGGGQVVQNGGFETGDFSGWTLSGNTNSTMVVTNSMAVHSGSFGAQLGSYGSLGFLSQSLATVPGAVYVVSLWLDSPDGAAPNEFLAKWNGSPLFDGANLGALGWTNLQFSVTASSPVTVLELGFRDDPAYLGLDDVTVTAYTNLAAPPLISTQPVSQAVSRGGSATFDVAASGSAPLGYYWYRSGTTIPGATSAAFTITNAQMSDSGSLFSCMVSNAYGIVFSSTAALTVVTGVVDLITFDDLTTPTDGSAVAVPNDYNSLQWNNVYVLDGVVWAASGYSAGVVSTNNVACDGWGTNCSILSATPFSLISAYLTAAWNDGLQVEAKGYTATALTYDNTYTLSATNPTFIQFGYMGVTEVDFSPSGGTPHPGYSGSGTHFVMDNLTVAQPPSPPSITSEPADQSASVGYAASFSVGAGGSPPLSYFWERSGAFIAGATRSCYTLTNCQLADSGSQFSCVVSNAYGTATSQTATLTVSINLVQNGGFETGDFTSWTQFGNRNYTSVTTDSAYVHSGQYGAQLGPPSTLGYLSQTVPTSAGGAYLLSFWLANPSAGTPNEFLASWNGTTLFDQTSLGVLAWTNLQFIVTATSSSTVLEFGFRNDPAYFGLDDISVAPLTNNMPLIVTPPVSQTVSPGASANFCVTAIGAAPLEYFWERNGAFIAGATQSCYTLTNCQLADSGSQFSCVVSNAYGTATSQTAILTVSSAGGVAYLRSSVGAPWGRTDNEGILTMVFGPGWQDLRYETVNPAFLFSAANKFIFLEGGADSGTSMATFLANNLPAMSNWVAGGGSLLIEAAPYFSSTFQIYLGFGATLNVGDYATSVVAANPAHPILNGPYLPVGTAFSGNYFSHSTVSGAGLAAILTNASDGGAVLAEKNYGAGHLLFGGMTLPSFQSPQPQATNLLANILYYAGTLGQGVLTSPLIVSQPQSVSASPGASASFCVGAIGAAPLEYFWERNGTSIVGATQSCYTLTNCQLADSGSQFSCVVSNAYGTATSQTATLTVSINLVQNGGFETGDFTSWTQFGNLEDTSVTTNSAYVHSGQYGAQLGPPSTLGYLSQTVPTSAGETYLLSLWLTNPSGETPNEFLVAWNGTTLFDQTSLGVLAWTNLQFIVTATSSSTLLEFGFRDDPAYLGLDDIRVTPFAINAPLIVVPPVSQTVSPGASANFCVTATGAAPLEYFWERNGALVAGATQSCYTLINCQLADSGSQFSCVVSNAYGTATSQTATLTVSANLVQNGGFETGDFTSWTQFGNTNYTAVTTNSAYVHSGQYGAELGPVSTLGYLSQAVPTSAGETYLLSLWLTNPSGETPNEFLVAWNGTTLFDQTSLGALAWTNLQFIVTATSSSTVLEFGFRDDQAYLGLDDISVAAATPAFVPGSLTRLANGQFRFSVTGALGANYDILVSGNLRDWSPLATLQVTNFPTVFTDTNQSLGHRFYRLELAQ